MKPPVDFTTGKDSRYDFTIDLEHGELAERVAAQLLCTQSVEVKAKRYDDSIYYVEYEQNPHGRGDWFPSGIKTTKATHWAFIYCENSVGVVVHVDVLREAGRAAAKVKTNWKHTSSDNPTNGIMVSLQQILDAAYQQRPFS